MTGPSRAAYAVPKFLQSYRMGFAVAAADMAERIGLVDLFPGIQNNAACRRGFGFWPSSSV